MTIESFKPLIDSHVGYRVKSVDILGEGITTPLVKLIVQTCSELTTIVLCSFSINDSAVITIAQHCHMLENMSNFSNQTTRISLLALSERGLPLKTLYFSRIPNISTADIARRCSHALSCIRNFSTIDYYSNDLQASFIIPYLTGLTSLEFGCGCKYIPILIQHCHKLNRIRVYEKSNSVGDILSLCRNNPLLQEFTYNGQRGITDTALIELIHACPHIHTLYLPYETDITDTGILALSEHCTQLKELVIGKCQRISEPAVLLLLQRCRQLRV